MESLPKPAYNPELGPAPANLPTPTEIAKEMLPIMRASTSQIATAELNLFGKKISHKEQKIPGPGGVLILSTSRSTSEIASAMSVSKPGIYFIHGGGIILANRSLGMNIVAD